MRTLLILLFLISFNSFGQERELIGKANVLTAVIAEMHKSGDVYTVTFKDINYNVLNEYKSFSFNEDRFEELYSTIIEFLGAKGKKTENIELPLGTLTLGKQMKTTSFIYTNKAGVSGRSGWMNKKQIGKLFGKN